MILGLRTMIHPSSGGRLAARLHSKVMPSMRLTRAMFCVLLATCTGLAAAGGGTFVVVPRDARSASEPMGTVVASIGTTDDFGYGVKAVFHRVGSPRYGYITFDYKGAGAADFSNGRGRTKVVRFDLAPGMYEVQDIELQTQELATRTYFNAREKVSIPFQVEPGRTTYLGELVAEAVFNDGAPEAYASPDGSLARKGRVVGAFFHVRNRLARDLAQATPGGSASRIIDASVSFKDNSNPLFRWEPGE